MTTLRSATLALFLAATLAHAQPAPVTGEGRVPSADPPAPPRTRYVLEGESALRQAGLIPRGYAYTYSGAQDGDTITYRELTFRAPGDEALRSLKLEYLPEVEATSSPGQTLFAGLAAAPVPLLDSTVGRLVLAHAAKQDERMVYTLRGWRVTKTLASGAEEVSFLVLASHARWGLSGKTFWVTDVEPSGWGGHWSLTRVDDPSKGLGVAHGLCAIRARRAPAAASAPGSAPGMVSALRQE